MRALLVTFAVCLLSWFGAAVALIYTNVQTTDEREALVAFVCAAIEIQEAGSSPLASEYARRFGEILAGLGESCPPKGVTP